MVSKNGRAEVNTWSAWALKAGVGAAVLSVLAACGGGGGDAGTAAAASSATPGSCATGNRTGLVAVGLYGAVGTAQVSSGGGLLGTTFGGSTVNRGLASDAGFSGACADSTGSATMRTAFATDGKVGTTHASINGSDQPVLLLDGGSLASTLADLAGTYNVLRFQKDTPTAGGSATTRSSYATLVVDGSGNWYFCKNTAAACSLGSSTGSGTLNLKAGSTDRFDLVAGGVTRATVFLSVNGANKVLVAGENDAGDPTALVTGLWIGAPRAAWAANDGRYMLNSTDRDKSALTMTGTAIAPAGVTATADQPLQGLLTATPVGGDDNYLLQTAGGVLVTANNTGNNFASGSGYFSFGVKP